MNWESLEETIEGMILKQQEDLLRSAQRLIPNLTADDILQPNDFPLLEKHPDFRYDEGILAGMLSVQMALLALKRDLRDQNLHSKCF